jgi:signal transduction histidine kinase
MKESDYQEFIKQKGVHGLLITMSAQSIQPVVRADILVRLIIVFLGTLAVFGAALSWRNVKKNAELQIRLVRAREQNLHLQQMNLAAAGLAHETRNPLNIIRGLAQMISREDSALPQTRTHSREIVDETDRVTAQLNEFINYSRPREVRRVAVDLNALINEVGRALNYDLEEKKARLVVAAEPFGIDADEAMLRQALFNLVLNAVQAVETGGQIHVAARKTGAGEASIEISDNGPGVSPENLDEIFKPYFTTHKKGTGLGLAVVRQIVLAHGWDIDCVPNQPQGALFRISHVKLRAKG